MNYSRVIPRDLFNEAKLLKCMGQLSLKIEDRVHPLNEDGGFKAFIDYNPNHQFWVDLDKDGYLRIKGMGVVINNHYYTFRTVYNSKSAYPLNVTHELCEYLVFDDNGNWDDEFIQFLDLIKHR